MSKVFKGFSWLWGCVGVQGTSSKICEGKTMSLIFGGKTKSFVSCFEGSKSHYFKDSFSRSLIRI
jgi:hypothetical protein